MRKKMKNRTFQRDVILACALSICLMTNYAMAIEKPSDAKDNYLSIEQSLLPIFSERYYTNENYPYNRINPGVKDYIHFYLEKDNSVGKLSAKAISLLGYVGNKDDIPFVDSFLQKFLINSDRERLLDTAHIANGAGCFSGMMIKRKIKGQSRFSKNTPTPRHGYPRKMMI
ncbi:MAG: hypothetical protein HQ580_12805 [Planctomycetes bacterium]|nr:hypothetical protein [Planctomycetota bacterium]